jgi:predicted NBD/HSP70 family sugar kinase
MDLQSMWSYIQMKIKQKNEAQLVSDIKDAINDVATLMSQAKAIGIEVGFSIPYNEDTKVFAPSIQIKKLL